MRFYDPEIDPPDCLDSRALFPKLDDEAAAQRCLKLGLLPSVTTVLAVLREEWLERWKVSEGIKHYQRTMNIWKSLELLYSESGRESVFGTEVHAYIHEHLKGEIPASRKGSEHEAHGLPLVGWLADNMAELIVTEKTLACRKTGCAGTIDLAFVDKKGQRCVADIKVVKIREGFKSVPPLGYRCQLSAYTKMLSIEEGREPEDYQRISLYLASPFGDLKTPQLKVFRYRRDYFPEFSSCLRLWHAQYGVGFEEPENPEIILGEPHKKAEATFDPKKRKKS
jgi:hypothetical protein